MTVPSEWLSDRQVLDQLGISKRTLGELVAVAPEDAPAAFVHIGVGVRYPRRRWRPDLLWAWLAAVQAHVANRRIVRKPMVETTPKAKAPRKPAAPRLVKESNVAPRQTLRARVAMAQKVAKH